MEYNTQREKMPMPEYGRCVQEMIRHAESLKDKAQRQRCAETIVSIMANMHPELRQQPDFMHRIWDHLAYISDYKLDVDYPFPLTRLGEAGEKPQPLKYPMKRIGQRQYGHLVEESLERLTRMPEGEERDTLLRQTAQQMKQCLYDWNRDAMDDEKVAQDVSTYTHGKVRLDLQRFRFAPVQTSSRPVETRKRKRR